MVSFKSFAAASIALAASFIHVDAAVAPTYPQPGAIQNVGQAFDITWNFMTGSNDNQTVLQNVAKGVKPTDLKYTYTAPAVDPNSAIYFFMFTGSKGDVAWTTRFGIAGADGKLTPEPEAKQPSGDAIPWGNGKLASGASGAAASSAAASSVPAAVESVNPTAAAVSSAAASASSGVAAVASTSSTPVAQAAASADSTSGASITKPVLTLVSAAVAGYFAF
ncbi:hypothetical protein K501DRAFT_188401 [Backusella circina FSU 941]|nr:hypothetical protein K501DRAFT_188401 [Backusella circina FSU 941]